MITHKVQLGKCNTFSSNINISLVFVEFVNILFYFNNYCLLCWLIILYCCLKVCYLQLIWWFILFDNSFDVNSFIIYELPVDILKYIMTWIFCRVWTKDKSFYNSVFYIQRTILGGILIFTVSFEEPFFVVKLHAIECNRLQNITSRASVSGVCINPSLFII